MGMNDGVYRVYQSKYVLRFGPGYSSGPKVYNFTSVADTDKARVRYIHTILTE